MRQPTIPAKLPSDPAAAYRLGYRHGRLSFASSAGAALGSIVSAAKSAAARANGHKGGRPRKAPTAPQSGT